jgi:hypothetical protein
MVQTSVFNFCFNGGATEERRASTAETIRLRNKCSGRFGALKPPKMLVLLEQNQDLPFRLPSKMALAATAG